MFIIIILLVSSHYYYFIKCNILFLLLFLFLFISILILIINIILVEPLQPLSNRPSIDWCSVVVDDHINRSSPLRRVMSRSSLLILRISRRLFVLSTRWSARSLLLENLYVFILFYFEILFCFVLLYIFGFLILCCTNRVLLRPRAILHVCQDFLLLPLPTSPYPILSSLC